MALGNKRILVGVMENVNFNKEDAEPKFQFTDTFPDVVILADTELEARDAFLLKQTPDFQKAFQAKRYKIGTTELPALKFLT